MQRFEAKTYPLLVKSGGGPQGPFRWGFIYALISQNCPCNIALVTGIILQPLKMRTG